MYIMKKIRIAIVGAAGYAGEELLRILSRHPSVEIKVITSRQNAGKDISEIFPRLAGLGLKFSNPDVNEILATCDAAFLALPHGLAAEYAAPLMKGGIPVFDISADFRLRSLDKYKQYYKVDHPAPELLKDAVYGLPERYRDDIRKTNLVACPGCYVTSILLPTTVLLNAGLVSTEGIIASSLSGVTGAGRKVDLPYIFPECNESVRAYAPTGHRHLPEIEQELAVAAGVESLNINFVPHLIPVNRGINSTIYLNPTDKFTPEAADQAFHDAYDKEAFVRYLGIGKLPDTKHVTFTNVCEIGCVYDKHTNKVILFSCIDNLTKGASGQAVQCMNIRFGLPETEGLL
jgi:N-acetyl-gamma-glutamyl-phosphate reductase